MSLNFVSYNKLDGNGVNTITSPILVHKTGSIEKCSKKIKVDKYSTLIIKFSRQVSTKMSSETHYSFMFYIDSV
jgi:hypothetical protein